MPPKASSSKRGSKKTAAKKTPKVDPRTYRARRRKELEDTKRKAKEDAAALVMNEKIHANALRSIRRLQACSRGFLARLFHMPRHKAEHRYAKDWSFQNAFNYYTDRQSELETRKERYYFNAHSDVEKWSKFFKSAEDLNALQSYYKESGLKSTLDDKMSFEEAKRFCCKKVHKRAIRRCLEVNVDFRRFYKKSKSGLSLGKNFIYFSKAISFSYLIIMLRDFKLLCNGVTHGEISRLFKKYAVQINEEREKVRARFSYLHVSTTHDGKFSPIIISECLKNLGCNHDTVKDAEKLLNGESHLSERDFLKFWQKHIGDNLKTAKATATKDKKKKKKGKTTSLHDLGLKLAGLKSVLLEIAPKVYQPEPSCRCAACQKKKLPPRSTTQDVHAKHALKQLHRYHVAPSNHHTSESELCSGLTVIGRNLLNFEDHVRWWLRFENNLKSLFVYYSSQAWDLAINQRKSWEDAVSERLRMDYSNFIRFASDFGIYPKYIGNDKRCRFSLLHSFLSAAQGTRTDPFHRCKFSSHITVGEGRHKKGNISAKYCVFCGERQYVLSHHAEEKLEQEFKLHSDKEGHVFIHDLAQILHHAGEDQLPAQEFFVEQILTEVASVTKKYTFYDPENNDASSIREGKCVNQGQFMFAVEQSRRLRGQILHGQLTFPEFMHALSLCATNAFVFEKMPYEWEFPMQEIFKVMDPTFRVKFGRAIETEVNDDVETDPLIDGIKKHFRAILETLYEKYRFLEDGLNVQSMSSDVFILFVQDCRILKKITYEQAINMFKATLSKSSNSMRLNFDQFCTAIDGLLFANFCSQESSPAPLSYFEPIGPGTGITHYGLTLRNAIAKLKVLYEQYNPVGRSTSIAPRDGPNMTRKSPERTMSPKNKQRKNKNRAGSFLRMASGKGDKHGGNSIARSRLKRAIRQKTGNMMKLSKLGFGTAFRREARAVHVERMIWDVLEEEEEISRNNQASLEAEPLPKPQLAEEAELVVSKKVPKAPSTNIRSRIGGKKRPGRTLKLAEGAFSFGRPMFKTKKKASVISAGLESRSKYLNLWEANSRQFKDIVGREKEISCVSPEPHQPLSKALFMGVFMDSQQRIKDKNAISVQTMHEQVMAMTRKQSTRKETMLSAVCNAPYHPGFGHLCLNSCVRMLDPGSEQDVEVIEQFFEAQQDLQDGKFNAATAMLKKALSTTVDLLLEFHNVTAPNDAGKTNARNENRRFDPVFDLHDERSQRASHILEALACVADAHNNHEDSEGYRNQQIHSAKSASSRTRGQLLVLAWESMGTYFARQEKTQDALKQFLQCRGEFESVADPHIKCRIMIALATLYQRLKNSPEAINCVQYYINIMQKEKDYKMQAKGYQIIGNICSKQENYEEAIKNWKDCLVYLPKRSLKRTAIHECIAAALEKSKKFQDAAVQYNSIVALQKNRVIACRYLFSQAKCHLSFLHLVSDKDKNSSSDSEEAAQPSSVSPRSKSYSYRSAIRLYEKFIGLRSVDDTLEAYKDVATAYLRLGDVLSFFGQEYHSAIGAYEESRKLANRIEIGVHGTPLMAQALYKLGCSMSLIGENHEAVTVLHRALLSSLDSGQPQLTCNIYKHLGRLKITFHENKDAKKYFGRCLALTNEDSAGHDVMGAHFDLGMCMLQTFDDSNERDEKSLAVLEEGIFHFNKLLDKAVKFKNEKRRAQSFAGLAECKWRMGENLQAVEDYNRCITQQKALGDTRGEMEQCWALGNLYVSMGEYAAARDQFEKQIKLAALHKDATAMQNGANMLSNVYTEIYRVESRSTPSATTQ